MVFFFRIVVAFAFIQVLIIIMSKYLNKYHLKQAKKKSQTNSESNIELFTWIADEPSTEKLLYDIVKEKKTEDNFKNNFIEFKKSVKTYMGEELDDYYLIRDILKQRLNGSVTILFNNLSKYFIPTVLIAFVTTSLISNTADILQSLFYLSIIIILFIYVVASISFTLLRKNNRVEILLLTIERIIIEEEKNVTK